MHRVINKSKFTVAITLIMFAISGCGAKTYRNITNKDHHTKTGFQNYPVKLKAKTGSVGFYLRRIINSFFRPQPSHILSEELALEGYHAANKNGSITWLGHSTFLIRIDGVKILTDPFLTDIAGPNFIGSKRYLRPGITLKNLPDIDIVIVSHDHYDHLDSKTISALTNKKNIHVFIPLGLKKFFSTRGYININEMDWGERAKHKELNIQALPSVHNSGRIAQTRKNTSLWASWSIRSKTKSIYFAGDTAYVDTVFNNIGTIQKGFDIALLPIGAYKPESVLNSSHVTPEQATQIGCDISANTLVGMHWGTIQLSDTPILEPPIRFKLAARNQGFPKKQVWIMDVGETKNWPATRLINPHKCKTINNLQNQQEQLKNIL